MTNNGTRDSLHALLGRLRTADFHTSDSVRIGASGLIRLGPYGTGSTLDVDCLVELVDSTSQQVVMVLDSVRADSTLQAHLISVDSTLDLLSGAYFVRIRVVPVRSIANRSLAVDSTWSESSLRTWIPGISGRRAIRTGPVAGNSARISAQPNPFGDRTEIRFSIHRDERVTIMIVDASGREIARPVRDERFEAGRCAVEFETGNLVEGTYVMELRAGSARAVEKLIIRR